MRDRCQFITGIAAVSMVGAAGCIGSDEESEPEEDVTVVLPPDSRRLFEDGELQEHNFAESSFTEDHVGTAVSEFDLANADTSNVTTMSSMFWDAESFD